jgi:hypothetical protein
MIRHTGYLGVGWKEISPQPGVDAPLNNLNKSGETLEEKGITEYSPQIIQ